MPKKELTISEFKEIIKEEALKLKKRVMLENEKRELELELKEIQEKNKNQLNEGLIQNIAAAIVFLTSSIGYSQNVDDLPYNQETKNKIEIALENPEIIKKLKDMGFSDNNINKSIDKFKKNKPTNTIKTRNISSDEELYKYLKMGYHLTSIETDTIIELIPDIAPDLTVEEVVLTLNDDVFFESGSFIVGEKEKSDIKNILDSIDNNGEVLLNVVVESSTDKQDLSINLQKKLKSLGYSSDNIGLSNARNNSLVDFLKKQGVDESLINRVVLFEKGEKLIDKNNRYVKIRFQFLSYKEMPPLPIGGIDSVYYPKTYELIKVLSKRKTKKPKRVKSCSSKVKNFKKGQVLCPSF